MSNCASPEFMEGQNVGYLGSLLHETEHKSGTANIWLAENLQQSIKPEIFRKQNILDISTLTKYFCH